jgi:PTH1 family peptidyl-tRNA hydrolase
MSGIARLKTPLPNPSPIEGEGASSQYQVQYIMKLIIGLGNPGKEYELTRHNIGFRVVDSLKLEWQVMAKCFAQVAKDKQVLYAKPQTFMNLSGKSVQALQQYYKIDLNDILVVYDDKDLPFGTLRFRPKGSSGGQNGMKSIIEYLGTEEIARLRIGIAPTDAEAKIHNAADYVLNRFNKEEEKLLPDIIKQAQEEIEKFLKG